MKEIPLKVLIIDPAASTAVTLAEALHDIDVIITVERSVTLEEAAAVLSKREVNAIYVDPINLGLDEASRFIFRVRRTTPGIVFVLYYEFEKERKNLKRFYAGERRRFGHYFKLDKATPQYEFSDRVKETVVACQHDLSITLTQDKIANLQNELAAIQRAASDENVLVPLSILKEIQDQLATWREEAKRADPAYKPAEFLGPSSPSVKGNQCFIVMPYSKDWSEGVEAIVRECCRTAGLEFTIAKTMEGRFVPHDVWRGITSSAVIIADLTGANANVTYEVGLADVIGCNVVLICQGAEVPFDFSGQRLILYENTVKGALKLKTELTDRLKKTKVQVLEKRKGKADS